MTAGQRLSVINAASEMNGNVRHLHVVLFGI